MEDFYLFQVLEDYTDRLVQFNELEGIFSKGERFLGYEMNISTRKGIKKMCAVKSNLTELVYIPMEKVEKIYKIKFEEITII